MDEQIQKNDSTTGGEYALGGGVDIVTDNADVDDIEIESYNDDIAGEGGELTAQDHIKLLRQKLREVTQEKQEYLDGWQRLKADFANFKKREEESKEDFIKFARENLIVDLLPVLESFQMAFANKEAWGNVDPAWRTGVEYIHTQLSQVLEGHGLTVEDPIGKDFDPREHESIGIVETTDHSLHHKIAEVVQRGYRLSGKLIRSAKVKIYGDGSDATKGA